MSNIWIVEIRRGQYDDRVDRTLAFTTEERANECFDYLCDLGEPGDVGGSIMSIDIPLDLPREDWATQNERVPRYEHDCDACMFLGQQGAEDVYYHAREGGARPTVIFRASSDGPDYRSGWSLCYELSPAIAIRMVAALGGTNGGA